MNSHHHRASSTNKETICLDYTDFLAVSCKKRWRFFDAIYGVMPIFGMVLKNRRHSVARTHKEQFQDLALQVISTQLSDETNILRLIDLAYQQKIYTFDIQLPYELNDKQLAAIKQACADRVVIIPIGDCINIRPLNI